MTAVFSKLAIIGAGISGIAAAKQLAQYHPVVFEATDKIGGVWEHASFHSTRLQTPRCDFEFSDYPWPDRDNATFPTNKEIVAYLHGYAVHFDVLKFVQFNSKVVEMKFVGHDVEADAVDKNAVAMEKVYDVTFTGDPVWEVAVKVNGSDEIQWYAFEFVVVCVGKYGDIPQIPSFPLNKGPEVFKGTVLHTLDYCKLSKDEATRLLRGKKVAIIGFKKSAIDLASECADANDGPGGKACTMVVRTAHWIVPHYWIWGLPFYLFYSTRSSQFIYERPNQGLLRSLACLLFSPMRKAVSKVIESYLLSVMPLEKYHIKPDHSFSEDYASCQMAIVPDNFFAKLNRGLVEIQRATDFHFTENGIQLSNNKSDTTTTIPADIVILATGYDGKKKVKEILPHPYNSFLEYVHGMPPLYRSTINPMIPKMAFVGYTETVSNLQAAELRCIWLSRMVAGKFKLPSVGKMLDNIAKEAEVMKKTTRFYRRGCVATYSINHNDEICEEMGWCSWRKKGWMAEAFSPYTSQDYKDDDHTDRP